MDETTLMALVAEGEATGKVEFKRELHLESADEKAEFIKDIISLSNSAPQNKGYLIVGINNSRYIVGIHDLEEERIQQLVHSHIRPSVKIKCTMVPTTVPGLVSVGVIEVEGIDRPHRVSIPTGKLKQDDVFVRHGSVVEKATPDEIRSMWDETRSFKEISKHIRAAETHLELGSFQDAIDIYTQAIKSMPNAELFLGRGKVYQHQMVMDKLTVKNEKELASLAIKDFSTAIRLTNSTDIEKASRFGRLRVSDAVYFDYKEWNEDVEWLKGKTEGYEFGEVLYLEYQRYEDNVGYSYNEPDEVFETITKSIESGYIHSGVYELRASASFALHNYGLALQDINLALASVEKADQKIRLLAFRGNIQVRMSKFIDAYSSLSAARTLYRLSSNAKFQDPWGYIASNLDEEILWRFGLESEFGRTLQQYPAGAIISVLRDYLIKKHSISYFNEKYAQIIKTINQITDND